MALIVLLSSFFVGVAQLPAAFGQTSPAPPGQNTPGDPNGGDLSQGASATQSTSPDPYYNANQYTNLVQQQAEQNTKAVAQNVEQQLWPDFGAYNDTYDGLSAFWGDDIISNLFSNIGQLIGKWLSEFINGWVADSVQFLTGFLRVFVLNPNIAVNGLGNGNGPADDISPYIRQGADIMYGIAVDLLLLLFVLCIWKYWAEAAWRGGGNMMGAVGRLIFTAGLLLAWPTIYAFEIQITNEMIKAIYFNSADQVAMLDAAMAAAVKGGLVAGAGLLANATAPVAGQVFGGALGAVAGAGGPVGMALGTVGTLVAFVGLVVYLVLGGILIAELIYILVLKSIQTALLCAQYMFAPLFIVFFATPDTENVCSGFVKSFVEVSLWTFVWVGMLKIMVIIVLSNFNPWGKIVMTVGVLQLMIQVPSFLSRAQISPMSDFVSAGLVTGGLLRGGSALANIMGSRAQNFANAVGNFGYAGAKGAPKSQATELNGLSNDVANPGLLRDIRAAQSEGKVPGGAKGAKDGKGGPEEGKGDGLDPTGKPINPAGPDGDKTGAKGAKDGKGDDPTAAGPPGKNIDPAAAAGAGAGVGMPTGPKAGDAALSTPGGPTGDKSVGDALASAGKAGALGAVVAAGVGAGLAVAETGGAAGDKAGAKGAGADGATAGQALSAQQQVAANLAAMTGAAGGAGGAVDKDGKPVPPPQVGPDGKPLKVAGGELPGGAEGAKGEKKDGTAAGATPDAVVSGTIKGAAGAKTTGPGAGETDAKGKELDASVGALNPGGVGAVPKAEGAEGAKGTGGAGQQIEMEFERGAEGMATAAVAGLGAAGVGKMGEVKDAGGGAGADGAKGGPTGGKQVVAGGILSGPGSTVNPAAGTTDVSGRVLDKKAPGQVVTGNGNGTEVGPAPSLSSAGLNTAVAGIATGRGLDPSTAGGASDVPHENHDPGAPITTPSAKTEVHSVTGAAQLANAGVAGGAAAVVKDAAGKIISGAPPQNPNASKAGEQLGLPFTDGKMNPGATGPGANVGAGAASANNNGGAQLNASGQIVPGATTAGAPAAGRGLEADAGPGAVVNTEIAHEEGKEGSLIANAATVAGATALATSAVVSRAAGQQTGPAGQAVRTDAGGKVVSGGPPVNPNAPGQAGRGEQMNLPFADGKINPGATIAGATNPAGQPGLATPGQVTPGQITPGQTTTTTAHGPGAGAGRGVEQAGGASVVNTEIQQEEAAAAALAGGAAGAAAVTTAAMVARAGAQTAPGAVTPGGVRTDATGKIVSGTGAPPPNPNAQAGAQAGRPGDQLSLPFADGKMNPGATGPGTGQPGLATPGQVTPGQVTPGQTTTTTMHGAGAGAGAGRGVDQQGNAIVNTEIQQEEGAAAAALAAGAAGVTTASMVARAGAQAAPGAVTPGGVRTDATGKIVSGTGAPPPNPNATQPAAQAGRPGDQLSLPFADGKMNPGATGPGSGQPGQPGLATQGQVTSTTSGAGAAGRGVEGQNTTTVNTEIQQEEAAALAAGGVAGVTTASVIARTQGGAGTANTANVRTDATGRVVAAGPPPNPNAAAGQVGRPGDQLSLPLADGKMNPGAPGAGANQPSLNQTAGQTTTTNAGGGRVETGTGIVNTEVALEEAAIAGGVASILNRVEARAGATTANAGQTVQTSTSGKVVTGSGGGQAPPPITPVAAAVSAIPTPVSSQFTQASSAAGGAPAAAVAGGAGGGGATPPPPPPPPFDEVDNPEGSPGTTLPTGEAGMGSQPASNRTAGSAYDGYMQSGYRHVPYRVAAAAIRLAQGATLAPSRSGRPEIIQDNQGHMMHVRFGEGSTDEQRAMQIMSGAYGELMSSDAEAYDAARTSSINAGEHKPKGLAQNIAAGILAYNGSSWTQTAAAKQSFGRSMAKHATLGAQSYVNGQAGNAYTEYLTNRYGSMSDEQQAWGVHIMTDASSPESGWSWRMGPATDALIQNGLPISPVHRAVAANPSVLKAQPWLRGAAIRGGVQYMQSRAEQTIPEGTNGLVQDAWYGNQAQAMAPEVVNTVGAITLALGEKACADTATIDKVAAMIGPQGNPEDAVGAYNVLKGGSVVMARMQQRFAPSGGGGGGGGGNMGSMTMNGGNMPSGPSSIGGVSTSVSGGLVGGGGGGGGGPRNNAEVDVLFGGGGNSGGGINPAQIAPPNFNLPSQSGSTQANFRVQANNQGGGGGNENHSIRMPGQNVGSTAGQVQIGSVSYSGNTGGGGSPPDRNVGVEVQQDMSGGGSYSSASGGDMQQAFAGALQQHGGSDNMLQRTVADLRSTGMQWSQIYDSSKSDNDPGKYQLLQTAMECQARDIPVATVAVAAKAMGSGNVTAQHVEIVQNMLDADPRWSPQNISYSDVYTAQALSEAHQQDPGLYGNAYLSKDYVDTVRNDPGFTPRPVPMRNAIGQIVDYAKSKVPEHLLMRKAQQGYGGGQSQGGGRGRGGNGGGGFGGFGGGGWQLRLS